MQPTAAPPVALPLRVVGAAAETAGAYEIVALGASLGGLAALGAILSPLPAGFPLPILVVHHLPPGSRNLLPRLLGDRIRLRVKPAEPGERPRAGTVHVAPPDHHLLVAPDGTLALSRAERENFCRPAIDVLFRSLAEVFGRRAVGVVLTGMGRDGARGLAAIRASGGLTMAQNEASAVAAGMPCAAIDLGGAEVILQPERLAAALEALADLPADGPGR